MEQTQIAGDSSQRIPPTAYIKTAKLALHDLEHYYDSDREHAKIFAEMVRNNMDLLLEHIETEARA